MFAQTVGLFFSVIRDLIAKGLTFLGIPPNLLTFAGCIFTCIGGVALAYGKSPLAFIWLVLAGAMDILDGAVAKVSDRKTTFGAVFDSCLDRFSDGAVFTGIIVFYAYSGMSRLAMVSCLAMIGAMATSYVRARAECVVDECKVGFWERPERIVFIMIALLFNHLATAMSVLAFFANWTAVHRIYYTWVKLHKGPGKEEQEEGLPLGRIEDVIYDIIFWKYSRRSWQYDVAAALYIALVVLVKL